MRFIFGVLVGAGIGFVGAILFAPEKKQRRSDWPPIPYTQAENHGSAYGVNGAMNKLRQRIDEALAEARKAQREAEKELRARYERSVGKEPGARSK